MKLNSTNKSPSRSRASSVFPCHSRCLTLSKRFDTSAPASWPLLLQCLCLLLQHRQPHGDVKPIDQMLAKRMQILLNSADILTAIRHEHLIAGKSDPLGQDRILERDKGKALAAHSTLNRLELSAEAIDARYHKIQAQPDEIEPLLIKRGVKAIPRKSAEIVLDFDATDDPLHGSQQGAYFHGYY